MKFSSSTVVLFIVLSISISVASSSMCETFLDKVDKGEKRCKMVLFAHITSLCGEGFQQSNNAEPHLSTCCCKIGCSDDTLYELICPEKKKL